MFQLAVLIGIYGYTIWIFGIIGQLNKTTIGVTTVLWGIVLLLRFKIPKLEKLSAVSGIIFALIALQSVVNLIGALAPELGFDALWYHLTIPKIFLQEGRIFYIPGGLFYYSVIPKLTEMLYMAALTLSNEVWAKLTHFGFGILTLVALYKLSRRFLRQEYAFLAVLVFYSNLVVSWQSITAYIDLARTFYEVMAIWAFVIYLEKKDKRWLSVCGVMLGFEIATKIVASGSLLLFILLLVLFHKKRIKDLLLLIVPALLIPLPWFVFAWITTGNPFYPVFSGMRLEHSINPFDMVKVFLRSPDPVSPIYVMFLPLVIYNLRSVTKKNKVLVWYVALAILVWFITPRDNGGRFILPYLPIFSLLVAITISLINDRLIRYTGAVVVLAVAVITIGYRGMANAKYLPVVTGQQSKADFMAKNMDFSFGDYYDVDGKVKEIVGNNKVLVIGGHNLFYMDFPFVHESYLKPYDKFNFILTQNSELPEKYNSWNIVYANDLTKVKLFAKQ